MRTPTPAALAVLLAALLSAPLGLAGHRVPSTPPASGGSTIPPSGPRAASPIDPATLVELGNIALTNGSYRAGNSSGPNGWAPTSEAYDSLDHRLFVGVAEPRPAILVLDTLDDQVVAAWPLPGGPADAPMGLAFQPAARLVFAADGASDNVSVFDATSGALLATTYLGTGADPIAVADDPEAGMVGVVEASGGGLALLNDTTGHLGSFVALGASPSAVAFDPAGPGLVAVNRGSDTAELVYTGAGTVGWSAGVGSRPDAVAFDPAEGRVLVANGGSDNVSALDPFNLTTNATFGTGHDPTGLTVTADGLVVVPNAGDGNATVFDDTTGTRFVSPVVGPDPVVAVYDPSEGHFFVAVTAPDDLVELAPTTGVVEGRIALGAEPTSVVAVGPSAVAVGDAAAAQVAFLNVSNATIIGRTPLPGEVSSLVTGGPLGRLYATDGAGEAPPGNLTMIDPVARTLLGQSPAGAGATGLAYDPAIGELFVADARAGQVEALDPVNGSVNATFPIPAGPHGANAVAVAVGGPNLFVPAGAANASVAVLSAGNGSPIASLSTPADPVAAVADPATGTVWVADARAGELTVLNASGATVLGNVTVPGAPAGIALDPGTGWILVADGPSGLLLIVDPVNRTILAEIDLGGDPVAVTALAAGGLLAVGDSARGLVAIVGPPPPTYPVTFRAEGLGPGPYNFSVTVDGARQVTSGPTLVVPEPNGTHRFQVAPVPGALPSPGSGQFVVLGGPVNLTIVFGPPTYNATFFESGLPSGVVWWVAVDGENLSGAGSELATPLPNGTFPFTAGTAAAFVPTSGSGQGSVVVAGAGPVPQVIQFVAVPSYDVVFQESGLPLATAWRVALAGQAWTSNGPTITVPLAPGTYPYAVATVVGLHPTPAAGNVTVSTNAPPTIRVLFAPGIAESYRIWFVPFGLPSGDVLTVVLNGTSASVAGTVAFDRPNGTYPFVIAGPDGWSAIPTRGLVGVAGRNVSLTIVFTALDRGTMSLVPLELLGVAATAVGAAVIGALFLRRRGTPPRPRVVTPELVRAGPPPPEPPTSGGEEAASRVPDADPPL